MARANVGGLELEYETFGTEGDPPLLLVMGLGAQLTLWHEDFCAELARRGFNVIRYDNRDIGLSTWLDDLGTPSIRRLLKQRLTGRRIQAPYTLEDMADDAAGLIDALGLGRAHVVGASMGGMIAQTLAVRHPGRVRTLTSIMSHTGELWHQIGRPRAMAALLRRVPPTEDAVADHTVRLFETIGSPAYPSDPQEMRARVLRSFRRAYHPAGFKRHLAAILASRPRSRVLKTVRAPTLVIHGAADPLVRPGGGRATARAVPNAVLEMIPGMGHDLPRPLWPRYAGAIERLAARG